MVSEGVPQDDRQTLLHGGDEQEAFGHAAVPPIYQTAPFAYDTFEAYAEAERRDQEQYVYWRGTNPTVELAERKLAELAGGEACKCFSSGMAAITAALMSSLAAGDHVVAVGQVYESTAALLKHLAKWGVSHAVTAGCSIREIEQALQEHTKVIYMESPCSMTFRLTDVPEVVRLARSRGLRTLIDNTWATPLFQKPLEHGVDLVIEAASKYLGGHNDLLAGAVIGSQADLKKMFSKEFELFGAALAPFEAWLLSRGLRTLPLRMKGHQEGGLAVARALEGHPMIARVNHPGLPSHPDYELGTRVLKGYSGVFSIELKDARFERVAEVINRMKRFEIAPSWGGYQSQVVSPNYGYNLKALERERLSPGLIRLAVGLEPPEELIADLEEALR
ncbi:trans-sulfuration enzyme family protein [Paenibacillus mucilaginosus]|uniref:homocysteine desulfhydrase n=1 Tax=Paenibacillus mucilaginosus (strain KNP414) TaxID=1036673 RepID=F8FI75_PAEMK|nr:PLP-dependent aspartate aminotransferase family protein [Paenibacillus mucilaginosus]AEI43978.1 possible methionine gamma-lyase [Paenibacillus mucilaginosus KNP414]MCG7212529.1 PLP-dependent aspartate aminotransferase family protein [Paenibacillus mucilaginosus]WDM25440.1 PLP-dependent transferase [Paenibacillus mucilaginosus]